MLKRSLKNAISFTWVVFVMAMLISLSGTFLNDIYRDNTFIKAIWRGNDVITFALAAPLMLYSMKKTQSDPSGNGRYLFVWLGCLWYMIYNYTFYLYGAAFSSFFLGYIVIIIASVLGLFHGLLVMNHLSDALVSKEMAQRSFRGTSIFLLLFGLLLGGMWVAMASTYLFTGVVPPAITQTGHPTGVVFATDLLFLVTPLITLSYYLWNQKKWAILLTPVLLVKCCLYPFVFVAAGIFAYFATKTYDPLTPVYLFLGGCAGITLMKLMRGFKNENTRN